jgi:hypothetical protein
MWGLSGFILGALLSGIVVSALGYSSASPTPPISRTDALRADAQRQVSIGPQRVVLSAVEADEVVGAIATMSSRPDEQRRIRDDLENRKYRLLWLTIWDWDANAQNGDTILITSDDYQRGITLLHHRSRIAIPEPRAGYIEFRGVNTEDTITISLLSGSQPIAMPRMTLGQIMRIEIDIP